MKKAPVIVFAYNRPMHVRSTLQSLSECEGASDSVLHIFLDGPKQGCTPEQLVSITETRRVVREKNWCGEVLFHESDRNKGLARSVIEGVSEIIEKEGTVIVLEDDLVVSKGFLRYMNDALERYMENEKVMQVSGYCFPAGLPVQHASFFLPLTTSWGWASWKRAWSKMEHTSVGAEQLETDAALRNRFDLDGVFPYSQMLLKRLKNDKKDSWAILWWWSVFKQNGLVLYPDRSLVDNRGFGPDGTHTKADNPIPLLDFDRDYFIDHFPGEIVVDEKKFGSVKQVLAKLTGKG